MKTVISIKSKVHCVVFNLYCFVAYAQQGWEYQELPGGNPGLPGKDPGEPPATPIDDWITLMLMVSILLLFHHYKKYQKSVALNRHKKSED